jgi:hypothetical protein
MNNTVITVQQLAERIAQVEIDINKLRSAGEAEKKILTLTDYKAYLQDELNMLKQGR